MQMHLAKVPSDTLSSLLQCVESIQPLPFSHFPLTSGSDSVRTGRGEVLSYTLSREYQVARYRYSRLLFTSEDRLCANLRVQ